jgi:hypothetical protein
VGRAKFDQPPTTESNSQIKVDAAQIEGGSALRRRPIINESMADIESEMSQVSEKRLAGVLGNGFRFVASQDDRSGAKAGSTQEI